MAIEDQIEMAKGQPKKPIVEPYYGAGMQGAPVTPTAAPVEVIDTPPPIAKLVSTYTDPETGDIIDVYDDSSEKIRKKGTLKLDAQTAADNLAKERLANKISAFDILGRTMAENGLEGLVQAAKDAIMNEETDAGRLLALRNSKSYQTRFAANPKRVANGFAAIDEATYLDLEDSYQSISQNYGLPEKFYKKDALGVQQYFEDAIGKNIDPVTFKERVVEGVKVLKANKTTLDAAKQFYPTLTDGDFLEYVLNPKNALIDIKNKVAAAEIGGAQIGAGLQATASGAEALARGGITGAQYQAQASNIAGGSLRGGQLASIYGQDPYTQQTAEQVALNIPGSADALKKTEKITGLEKASFNARTGLTGGALARDRAGGY